MVQVTQVQGGYKIETLTGSVVIAVHEIGFLIPMLHSIAAREAASDHLAAHAKLPVSA